MQENISFPISIEIIEDFIKLDRKYEIVHILIEQDTHIQQMKNHYQYLTKQLEMLKHEMQKHENKFREIQVLMDKIKADKDEDLMKFQNQYCLLEQELSKYFEISYLPCSRKIKQIKDGLKNILEYIKDLKQFKEKLLSPSVDYSSILRIYGRHSTVDDVNYDKTIKLNEKDRYMINMLYEIYFNQVNQLKKCNQILIEKYLDNKNTPSDIDKLLYFFIKIKSEEMHGLAMAFSYELLAKIAIENFKNMPFHIIQFFEEISNQYPKSVFYYAVLSNMGISAEAVLNTLYRDFYLKMLSYLANKKNMSINQAMTASYAYECGRKLGLLLKAAKIEKTINQYHHTMSNQWFFYVAKVDLDIALRFEYTIPIKKQSNGFIKDAVFYYSYKTCAFSFFPQNSLTQQASAPPMTFFIPSAPPLVIGEEKSSQTISKSKISKKIAAVVGAFQRGFVVSNPQKEEHSSFFSVDKVTDSVVERINP